jgi:hypothetical protein
MRAPIRPHADAVQAAYSLLPELADGSTECDIRSFYRELGAEAMKENADWVAIYR